MRTCQLEGCENSLEGKNRIAMYCCRKCGDKAYKSRPEIKARIKAQQKKYRQKPEFKTKNKARQQTPEYKARKKEWSKIYCQIPEIKERDKILSKARKQKPEYKAQQKKYYQKPEVKALRLTPEYKAHKKRHRQKPEYKAQKKLADQKRRAQKATLLSTFTLEDWNNCLEYFDHKCAYCGANGALHQEHFIPLSKDGPYTPDNIICACPNCNNSKYNNAPEDWCSPEQYERVASYLLERVNVV